MELKYFEENSIVLYYKSSLSLTIIDRNLLLLGGAAYDHCGVPLLLPEASYDLMDSLSIAEFEDQKTYFFYLATLDADSFPESPEIFFQKKLLDRVYFLVSRKAHDAYIFLGKFEVDYHLANVQNRTEVSIPLNVFYPEKNQIDIRGRVHTQGVFASGKNPRIQTDIGKVVWNFADTLHGLLPRKKDTKLPILLSEVVNLYGSIQNSSFSPENIYKRFEVLAKIFSWVDFTLFSLDAEKLREEFISLFTVQKREFFASFYYLDFRDEKSFIYQALRVLNELRTKLEGAVTHVENIMEEYRADSIPEEALSLPKTDISEVIDNNASLDEGASTVLLENATMRSLQIGRGRHSGNDIVLCPDDKTVSRIHLRLIPYKNGFFLEDLSSMGTYVDGERIEKNIKTTEKLNGLSILFV